MTHTNKKQKCARQRGGKDADGARACVHLHLALFSTHTRTLYCKFKLVSNFVQHRASFIPFIPHAITAMMIIFEYYLIRRDVSHTIQNAHAKFIRMQIIEK
jgi:purine-cytosine permease-like protein